MERYIDGERVGKIVTVEDVIHEVIQDKVFYETSGGGVTISGGEPLSQPDFTAEILRSCRQNSIHTAIETSGYASKKALDKVLQYCDLVLFDIKETDSKKHLKYTGVEMEPILENLNRINEAQIPFVIRMPIIPSLNDRAEHFAVGKELREKLRFCQGIDIMPYHKLGKYKYEKLGRNYLCSHIEEPTKLQIEEWKKLL
jgi:pyruvate formate lyase activating enzyme